MRTRSVLSIALAAFVLAATLGTTACRPHKGPAQRTGEKIDRALGTDK